MADFTHIHKGTGRCVSAERVVYEGAKPVTGGNAFARKGDYIVTHKKPPVVVGSMSAVESWIVPGVIFDDLYEPFKDISEGL